MMIETNRLLIRPMTNEDALHLFELNSDPEVVRYTGDTVTHNFADAQRILTDLVYNQFNLYKMGRFTVLLKDGTYLGWCGLKYFPETKEVDLGYRFMRKFWGQGFATEASQAILKYGFEELKLHRILARAMPANLPSIKVLQKLGMTYRGVANDPHYASGFVLYDITAEEFKNAKINQL
jgi:ribosomal-protein-alanine N-acetyltransferase